MRNSIVILLFSIFAIYSCRDKQHEENLIKREHALQVREDSLAAKETEYISLIKMRDSILAVQDSMALLTVKPWPDSIAGKWNTKLICTESNCNDYVIGDQRTYTWEFYSDSLRLITKVLNNKDNLVREYNSIYSDKAINLSFHTDSTVSKPVIMNVELNKFQKDKIKGIHTITIDNSCMAKFSVELTRSTPNK